MTSEYIAVGGTHLPIDGAVGLTYNTGWTTGSTRKFESAIYSNGSGNTINGSLSTGLTAIRNAQAATNKKLIRDLAKVVSVLKAAGIINPTFNWRS